MNFISSIFLGSEGSYNFLGHEIEFNKNLPSSESSLKSNQRNTDYLKLDKSLIHIISFSFIHTLVHELGHALINQLFTEQKSKIFIDTHAGAGSATCPGRWTLSNWKVSLISAAGPMANMAFSIIKLAAAYFLKAYLPWRIILAIGISSLLAMAHEMHYAYTSVKTKDSGDFDTISKNGSKHLILASTVLITQFAVGLLLLRQLTV